MYACKPFIHHVFHCFLPQEFVGEGYRYPLIFLSDRRKMVLILKYELFQYIQFTIFVFVCVFCRLLLIRWIMSIVSCCSIRTRSWGKQASSKRLWTTSVPTKNRSVTNWQWRRPEVCMSNIFKCYCLMPVCMVWSGFCVTLKCKYNFGMGGRMIASTYCFTVRSMQRPCHVEIQCLKATMKSKIIISLICILFTYHPE